jgi:hypothetical protein
MYRLVHTILFFFLFLHVDAQEPGWGRGLKSKEMNEQIQVERIAFFTEKIGLTTEEAQKFWPVYNEVESKRSTLFEEKASVMRRFMKDRETLSEKETDDLLVKLEDIQKKELQLQTECNVRLKKILSSRKIMELNVAEMEFRTYLLRRVRIRRDDENRQQNSDK